MQITCYYVKGLTILISARDSADQKYHCFVHNAKIVNGTLQCTGGLYASTCWTLGVGPLENFPEYHKATPTPLELPLETCHFAAGTHIDRAVQQLLHAAIQNDSCQAADFNGVRMTAYPSDTVDAVRRRYDADDAIRYAAYLASARGQDDKAAEEARNRAAIITYDAVVQCFDDMSDADLNDPVSIMRWAHNYGIAADYISTRERRLTSYPHIRARLLAAGYVPGAPGGDLEHDLNARVRHIMGQFLASADNHDGAPYPHGVVRFADDVLRAMEARNGSDT